MAPPEVTLFRRLSSMKVRPGRLLAWLTTRRMLVLIALLAAIISADQMRRKRDRFLLQAGQWRTRGERARESRAEFDERCRREISWFRHNLSCWVEQSEANGAAADAERCRLLVKATDRFIEATRDESNLDSGFAAYRDEVARLTAGARENWVPRRVYSIDDQLRPDSLGNFNQKVSSDAETAALGTRIIAYYSQLAAKYERAVSHPWETVEPDPPLPR